MVDSIAKVILLGKRRAQGCGMMRGVRVKRCERGDGAAALPGPSGVVQCHGEGEVSFLFSSWVRWHTDRHKGTKGARQACEGRWQVR